MTEDSTLEGLLRENESVFSQNYQKVMGDFKAVDSLAQNLKPDFFVAIPVLENGEIQEIQKKYTIAAVDGSQIVSDDLDVQVSPFVLINIGLIQTNYPKKEVINFDNYQHLITANQSKNLNREVSAYRTRSEFEISKDMIEKIQEGSFLFIDGGLLQWHLTENVNQMKEEVLALVSNTLQTSTEHHVHILGFISGTTATDVVGSLRMIQCTDKSLSCSSCDNHFCYLSSKITDATLFTQILKQQRGLKNWQLSPVFKSNAPMISKYYDQDVYFFYIYNQVEFARVECTGFSLTQLSFVIGVLLDQLEKGFGYPVVLQEAHELAVLKHQDKLMIEQYLISQSKNQGNFPKRRMKNLSKNVKYI